MEIAGGKDIKIIATVIEVKGHCTAGHNVGDAFPISCHNPGGLCGFFYHNIFPNLSTYQYGGKYPWWQSDTLIMKCPDPYNQITIKLEKIQIE